MCEFHPGVSGQMQQMLAASSLSLMMFPPSFPLATGCTSKIPIRPGRGNSEARRTGEENRQSCGGLKALLGGPQGGKAGKVACRSLPLLPTAFGGHP